MIKFVKILAIMLAGILVFGVWATFNPINAVSQSGSGTVTVCIDAGHGGIDGGVEGVTSHVKESDLNLDIAKKLEKNLSASGINVVMTRKGLGGLYGLATKGFKKRDMQKRKEIINSCGASLLISIHLNKCPYPYRRGAQVFYRSGNEAGKKFAFLLQERFNLLPSSERDFSALPGDYYILNCTDIAAVICECGFLSNTEDEKLLLKEEYREQIAYLIYECSLSFLLSNGYAVS